MNSEDKACKAVDVVYICLQPNKDWLDPSLERAVKEFLEATK